MLSEQTRATLLRTLAGRAFLVAAAIKLVLAAAGAVRALPEWLAIVEAIATLVILGVLLLFVWRLARALRKRLLWRVRRKLILSYIFMGVVPALLIAMFFLVGAFLLFLNLSSYLFRDGYGAMLDTVQLMAGTAAAEISRTRDVEQAGGPILERRRNNLRERYPEMSLAIVPLRPGRGKPLAAGPWRHLTPPTAIPDWVVKRGEFRGTLALVHEDAPNEPELVLRGVQLPEGPDPAYAVVVDLPFDGQVIEALHDQSGIRAGGITITPRETTRARPVLGRLRRAASAIVQSRPDGAAPAPEAGSPAGIWERSVAFLEYTDWETGASGRASLSLDVTPRSLYARIAGAQPTLGGSPVGQTFLVIFVVIAALFIIIQLVALTMGVALAKSITGAVHELFAGTERVRQGDFTHRIAVKTQDQLGELAASFNTMTESIEHLLQTEAEKKRLEEELRIAREIQMSLLPRGPLAMPGLEVTALCVPAREVGGDYYDYFPLDPGRVAILVADVSGKGTSAALYMAELKGLLLSLAQRYESPRELLIEVNRILSDNLDSRSFITMTYAVFDLNKATMTYCRAGHTPMIYLPARGPKRGLAQALLPGGLVVGLRIDGIHEKFTALLEEEQVPLDRGDVFVMYTDGVTEAMDADQELFGESRLRRIVEEHGHLRSAELRERILREVESFVGEADQHDDLTLILVKVLEVGVAAAPPQPEVAVS